MNYRIFALLLALPAALACAAPPPGHPTPAQAGDMLHIPHANPEDLPHQGKVLQTMDSNDYTYIEVEHAGQKEWLAAPKAELKPGMSIRYSDGVAMKNFYSKVHKRTFPSVMFVDEVAAVPPASSSRKAQ